METFPRAFTYLFNLAYVLSVLNAGASIPANHWSIFVLVPSNAALLVFATFRFYRMPRAPVSSLSP